MALVGRHHQTAAQNGGGTPQTPAGAVEIQGRETFADSALVHDMHRQVHTMHVALRRAEARAGWTGRLIATSVAVLSAVTATSIFATLQQDPALGWRITVGIMAVLTAALGALQSSLGLSQQQAHYRSAAESYGRLRRDLEVWVAAERDARSTPADAREWLDSWCKRWKDAEAGAPAVSNGVYHKAEEDVKARETL